jgi:spore coat protein A, manganese oxidase
MQRRDFVKLLSIGVSGLFVPASGHARRALTAQKSSPPKPGYEGVARLLKYVDPLPIPSYLQPVRKSKGKLEYKVRMMQFQQRLHSQLPPSTLWGFEGKYPGPVIEGVVNEPVSIEWINQLPEKHLYEIDTKIHGAMPPTPEVRTVAHLHGANTASEDDGLPEKWIQPGHSVTYHYPNQQRAATLWYHDHALGITRLNNYAGLAGMYFLRGDEEKQLGLPEKPYEIPLVLQDRLLNDDGHLIYSASSMTVKRMAPGVWGPEFFGNVPVVNGAIFPYLEVEPRRYRFRAVNASNSRFFSMFFSDPTIPFSNVAMKFFQIGTDGGLLPQPLEVTSVLLGPGERADLIVDFAGHEGKKLIVSNYASAPFPGTGMDESPMKATPLQQLMEVRVTASLRGKDSSAMPAWSIPFERLQPETAVKTRDLVLYEYLDAQQNSHGLKINRLGYDDPVTENPKLNTTEIWRFINTTDDTHPMHIHLVQFQILERKSFDLQKYLDSGVIEFSGRVRMPEKNEIGWKDTVRVNPNEVVSIIVPFRGFTGKYVYHCHMLEHEDNDMMRPFQVMP